MSKNTSIAQLATEFPKIIAILEKGVQIRDFPVQIVQDDEKIEVLASFALDTVNFPLFLTEIAKTIPQTASGALIALNAAIIRYNNTELTADELDRLAVMQNSLKKYDTSLKELAASVYKPFTLEFAQIDWSDHKTAQIRQEDITGRYNAQYALDRQPLDEQVAETHQKIMVLQGFRLTTAKDAYRKRFGWTDKDSQSNVTDGGKSGGFAGIWYSKPYNTGKRAIRGVYRAETNELWVKPTGTGAEWTELPEIELKSVTGVQKHVANLAITMNDRTVDGTVIKGQKLLEAAKTCATMLESKSYTETNTGGSAKSKKIVGMVSDPEKQVGFMGFDLPDDVTTHFETIQAEEEAFELELAKSDAEAEEIEQIAAEVEEVVETEEIVAEATADDEEVIEDESADENDGETS